MFQSGNSNLHAHQPCMIVPMALCPLNFNFNYFRNLFCIFSHFSDNCLAPFHTLYGHFDNKKGQRNREDKTVSYEI